MTIRLRAHHLLCMLTWAGRGYTPGFTVNYDRIARRIMRGETLELVEGPDDICAPLLSGEAPHCYRDSVRDRDLRAQQQVGRLLGRSLSAGSRIRPDARLIARLRRSFARDEIRSACEGCEWSALCSGIAGSGFRDVHILPPDCEAQARSAQP